MSKSGTTAFASSATNEPYSKISGDFNPIRINPYFADFAALPGTITHGMRSSAATRVEHINEDSRPLACGATGVARARTQELEDVFLHTAGV
ncbi:uncharacterized protein B0H18DRAFT_1113835 [Fomitopsis serialis]|nr:uncharacterized protein B0H18DRAFT_1113835 [Neoantrodia serialis]KAH9936450.1 hypothetical protein B0H18DRAFT_1113835 [Neoantrodia serialis]